MGHPELRLLYVTPETLFTARVNGFLRAAHSQRQLARLVIDEVSCLSSESVLLKRIEGSCYRRMGFNVPSGEPISRPHEHLLRAARHTEILASSGRSSETCQSP